MFNKCLSLFIISAICSSYAFEIGDECRTKGGVVGTCKYVQTCKQALDATTEGRRNTECGYEGTPLVVCCPYDHETDLCSRFFEGTDEVKANNKLTCQHDSNVPTICCPTIGDGQPPEDKRCPPLPSIPTPTFNKPAHTVAWEKCVANERYVNICKDPSQPREYACNISAQGLSGWIPALPKEFPHIGVLGCNNNNSSGNGVTWVGSGSLISDRYILTAASVLFSQFGQVQYVVFRTLNRSDMRHGEPYGVVKVIPHMLYSAGENYHDIALVLLNRRVTFSEFIRPICLPVPGIDPEDSVRLLAGWGGVGVQEHLTDILLRATIFEVNSAACNTSLASKSFVWNDETMICGGGWQSHNGFTDTCRGDIGGPLMYQVTNPEFSCNYVVAGVVSSRGVCAKGIPGSYTRVSAYLDWIVETVWPDELANATAASY